MPKSPLERPCIRGYDTTMKFLAHACLALLIFGGNLSPGTITAPWTACAMHMSGSSLDQEVAISHKAKTGSCCRMTCCDESAHAAEASTRSCCQIGASSDEDSSPQVPTDSSSPESCPCCPGSCCLISAGIPFCLLKSSLLTGVEQVTLFSLRSETPTSRRDEPALPPPRIWSA